MKRDGYNFKDKWNSWKENNFKTTPNGIRAADYKLLIQFLKDCEEGINVTPIKRHGKVVFNREAGTLLNLSSHILFFLKNFNKPLLKLKTEDMTSLQKKITDGKIKKRTKANFKAFGNYIKDFKAFWNWMIRTNRITENITRYSSSSTDKPSWVFLGEDKAKKFFNSLLPFYRMATFFMYDSGMRVTEGNSIQIKHFSKDFKQVIIPDEAAKTFGRTINLKLCSDLIKQYVQDNNMKDEDFLFQKDLWAMNKYLKKHCRKMFGEGISDIKAKGKYSEFTLYDIRHNSACFWLNRYPTPSSLMYRFGWQNSDKIGYYSDFLGQADKLTDSDMIAAEDKSKLTILERQFEEMKKELEYVKDELKASYNSDIKLTNMKTMDGKKILSRQKADF